MGRFSDKDIESAVSPFVKEGKVALGHLDDVFKTLGLDLTTDEIKNTLKSNHYHAGDELTVSNFQSIVSRVASAKLCERQLLAEFRRYDLNGDGHISRAEAKAALQADGVQLSEEDFDDFMKTADLNGDGKVDYEEFARIASAR